MSSGHLAYKTSTLSSSSPLSIIWWDNSITMACSQSLCLFISLFLLPLIHCRNQVICLLVSPTFWMCVHFHIVSSNLFFFLLPFSYKWALEDWFDWDSDFFFFGKNTSGASWMSHTTHVRIHTKPDYPTFPETKMNWWIGVICTILIVIINNWCYKVKYQQCNRHPAWHHMYVILLSPHKDFMRKVFILMFIF